jgi:pimeloyl-ACP methyl ester carboxylesterase
MTTRRLPRLAAVSLGLGAGVVTGAVVNAQYRLVRWETLDHREFRAPDGRYVTLPDGAEVNYVEAGAGFPVVLIHGFGYSHHTWRFNQPALAGRYRAVALDLPGFGASARTRLPRFAIRTQARAVRDFIRELGIDRAHVVGHSLGGTIALRLALDHPEAVARLVVVDSPLTAARFPYGLLRRAAGLGPVGPAVFKALFYYGFASGYLLRSGLARSYGPDPVPEGLPAYFEGLYRVRGSADTLVAILKSPPVDPYLEADLPDLRVPLLAVWGGADRVVPPRVADRLRQLVPAARVEVLPGAGHSPHETRPAEFNRLVLEFLTAEP